MGEHNVDLKLEAQKQAAFAQHLLDDIKALEYMLANDLIESGPIRIGAEQEFCLVDENFRPSVLAEEILKKVNDPHFTTELAKYNLEINLDPFELNKECFQKLENQLIDLLNKAKETASEFKNKVILTGILPTISKTELDFDYMTPNPRYWALNEMLKEKRGGNFDLYLTGVDELAIQHDSVLFEACNTSFQMHLQIDPNDFISSYNWAQAISGPLLGIASNSPLLLGRELWSETRIALFQQSIDTRSSSSALKDQKARVTFGDQWEEGTIADIYKHDIAQYNSILTREIEKSSLDQLKEGEIPKLKALSLNNGTIYKWNRPCYGVGGGKAHVRIENRYIPSGPSIKDEMANFVFWVGLMIGRPKKFDDMQNQMDFRDAKLNFINAARMGKRSVMVWEEKEYSIPNLLYDKILPIAEDGLKNTGFSEKMIQENLRIIAKRAENKTGAQWLVSNYRQLKKNLKSDDALLALTESMYHNQEGQKSVIDWPCCEQPENLIKKATKVEHIMTTNLFSVQENDLASLALSIMSWKRINHLPVEDRKGNLVGLLTHRHIRENADLEKNEMVSEIMVKSPITVGREFPIQEAEKMMLQKDIGCLPVMEDGQLVGILTVKDLQKLN